MASGLLLEATLNRERKFHAQVLFAPQAEFALRGRDDSSAHGRDPAGKTRRSIPSWWRTDRRTSVSSDYGSVAGVLLATPVARGMVGAATPRTLVTELPLELTIHRFPEISMATLVGELSPPPV